MTVWQRFLKIYRLSGYLVLKSCLGVFDNSLTESAMLVWDRERDKNVLRLRNSLGFLGLLALFLCAVIFGFVLMLTGGDLRTSYLRLVLASREEDLKRAVGTDDSDVIFEVAFGDTPSIIAENLLSNNLILDSDLFVTYSRVEGLDTQFEAGTYFLNQTMTIPQIAVLLTDSRNSSINFRVVEGSRIEEIAESIDNNPRFSFYGADFLKLALDSSTIDPKLAAEMGIPAGVSLEGFMFPDTYTLAPDITAKELVQQLFSRFVEVAGEQLRLDANSEGLTMREVVTLASIVEREAVWEDENPIIASVYLNRLNIGMKLEADPTVQYGLNGTRDSTWWPQITQADYQGVNSLYNTYIYYGLPPGPIANPSLSAISGVIYPAKTEYLYFRARCDGSNYHNFSQTFDEHVANGC